MASPRPGRRSRAPSRSLAGRRALVIGADGPEHRRLLDFLSGWGISVEATTNPLHGVALLWSALEAEQPFHLTLFGPQGQGVPGEPFAALVRGEPRLSDMPLLQVGDSAGTLRKAALRRIGFFDVIAVPIDKTMLFDTLHRACGNLVTGQGVVRLADRHTALGPLTPRLDILLADPNPEQRRMVRSTLARGGHQIFEVGSGEETIDALTKHSFDLIIVALELPVSGGGEAVKLFPFFMTRDAWPACIGLARDPSTGQAWDWASAGITMVLNAPVQPQALLEAVAGVIRGNGEATGAPPTLPAAAPWALSDVPCLDEQALQDVERLSADPHFLYELIQKGLGDIGTALEGVRETLGTTQCHRRLREFGHMLQDNAGSLGALQLYQLGRIAAEYPRELFERDGEQLVSRIEAAYQRTRGAFWQYLQQRTLSHTPG
jgi:two-component system, sensor histidine kinase RpfC